MKIANKFKMQELMLILVFVMVTVIPSYPQIFLIESSDSKRSTTDDVNGACSNVIVHGDFHDQTNFVPLCGGNLLFLALGGMYLLNKRKK